MYVSLSRVVSAAAGNNHQIRSDSKEPQPDWLGSLSRVFPVVAKNNNHIRSDSQEQQAGSEPSFIYDSRSQDDCPNTIVFNIVGCVAAATEYS